MSRLIVWGKISNYQLPTDIANDQLPTDIAKLCFVQYLVKEQI